MRKHEIGTEEKIVELYPDGYRKDWHKHNNGLDISHYVLKHKEHEARRASANERQEYWQTYRKYLK